MISKRNGVNPDETQFDLYFNSLRVKIDQDSKNEGAQTGLEIVRHFKKVAGNVTYWKRLILLIPPWLAVGTG